MRRRNQVQHGMQGIFVFVLLGLFAVMSTLLVLLGTQMYRSVVAHTEADNERRVLYAYVRNMMREEDAADAVEIEDHEDLKVIALHETIGTQPYVTRIYSWDGQLWEQFTREGRTFAPEAGTVICPVGVFEPELDGGLLSIHMEDTGGTDCSVQMALYTSSGDSGK